jgi:FlaG/FlaF family flagellin (archaellin)
MKTKNASGLVVGIVITLFVIILSGTVIVWGSGYFNQNKKTMDKSTAKIDQTIGSMTDFDLAVYDGKSIQGEALTKLIKDIDDKKIQISIGVHTIKSKGYVYYVNKYDGKELKLGEAAASISTTKTDDEYINPNGTFLGKVIRNENKDIICIEFEQQP